MNILFVTLNEEVLDALRTAFEDVVPTPRFDLCRIEAMAIPETYRRVMYVSPANSLGFMDGGIDAAYMEMFPGIQAKVQNKIRELGHLTTLGRPYLSIGSAIVVPVDRDRGSSTMLVSAPTMFLPHDVSMTRNAYDAMMATLIAYQQNGADLLVTTGLCCGYGRMPGDVAARQMREAFDDFNAGRIPQLIERLNDPSFVITQNRDYEQPCNYDNREIQEPFIWGHATGVPPAKASPK
jgi:O-acetyl-ADP-ribose deacetylase (regulator of RNase III)